MARASQKRLHRYWLARLRARKAELHVRVASLNRFTQLGCTDNGACASARSGVAAPGVIPA